MRSAKFPSVRSHALCVASGRSAILAFVLIAVGKMCTAEDGRSGAESARVKAKAFLSVKKLPAGGECEILVLVNIQNGWHINSHSTEKEWQIPTELTVTSKFGTKLARVSYPKGRLARVPGSQEPLPVYERQATIRGVLAIPREAAGRTEEFRIQLRYQACNDRECEQPKLYKLAGKVAIAGDGEPIEEANANLFPKSR
jgi:thiol:disulfide interchange protein DsbD